jgi:hypothetical protein
MNIITTVQGVTERRLLERPLAPGLEERIGKEPVKIAGEAIIALHEKLDILNAIGIDFFDTCAALSITDPDALHRFIQLVLKDKQ